MFDGLFGGETPLAVKFIVTFIVVLALIPLLLWVVRRIGGTRLGSPASRGGRQPRLAVIDAASIDGRRRLVLIRRDNVEHLVLIGGPADVVIEQNIVRAVPVAQPREAPPVRAHGPEAPPRPPEIAPRSEPAPRPPQPDAAWIPPEPVARSPRPAEPVRPPPGEPMPRPVRHPEPAPRAQPPVDLPTRPLPEPVSAAMRAAAAPESARTPPAPKPAAPRPAEGEQPVEMRQSPPTADVNLADMAQRLEAALRRPARSNEAREAPSREAAPRPEPKPRLAEAPRPSVSDEPAPPPEPPPAPEPEPPAAGTEPEPGPEPAKPAEAAAEPKPAPAKSVFDSLEEEMANLLGRPQSKP